VSELLTRLPFSHRQTAAYVLYPAIVIFALADLTPRRKADGRSLGQSRQEAQVSVLFGVTGRIAANMTARYGVPSRKTNSQNLGSIPLRF